MNQPTIIYDLNNQDRYGFYTVGDKKTYSKLQAIEYHKITGSPIRWHYNEDVYKKFNWSQEPAASLDDLYRRRAQQIRDQYDYLVLWYSGGADSHNVLQTFVQAGIYIDEIAQYTMLEAHQGDKYSSMNEEVYRTSIPVTQELLDTNPIYKTTKHRVVDITKLEVDYLSDPGNKWDHFYKVNTYYCPSCISRYQIRESVDDYRQMISAGKKVCFIYGAEKPIMKQDQQGWWLQFSDGQDNAVSAWAQMQNFPGDYNEFFYWAPDMPEIPAKQAHIIKKYCQGVTLKDVDNIHLSQGRPFVDEWGTQTKDDTLTGLCFVFENNGQTFNLTLRGLHRLLYSHWDPHAVVQGKPSGHMFPNRDSWLHISNSSDVGQKYYTGGAVWLRQYVRNIDPSLWWEYKYDPKKTAYNGGIAKFYNTYFIGPSNIVS